MTAILIAIAAYIWGLLVSADNPQQLSVRRAFFAPVALPLFLVASLLVTIANLLSGTDAEVSL